MHPSYKDSRDTFPGRSVAAGLRWIAVPVVCLALFGCGGESSQKTGVVLGAVFDTTGEQSGLGAASVQGARLAVDLANRGGGLFGSDIELIVVDGKSNPDSLKAGVSRVMEEHPSLSALFGLSDSDLTLDAASVAAARKILFLTSGATSPLLPAEVPDYLFLACFGDNVQAAAGAEWAYRELSARRAILLYDSTRTYPCNMKKYFQIRFSQLGGEFVEVHGYDPGNLSASLVKGLPKADIVYLAAEVSEEAIDVIDLLRKAHVDVPIMGGDGYDTREFWNNHREVSNVFFTTHAYLGADNTNESVREFLREYRQEFPNGEPDAFTALGYDAAGLLMNSARLCGSGNRDTLRAQLAATKDYHGVTGTISYVDGSRIPKKSVSIVELKNGSYVFRGETMPESVPAP